MALKRRKSDVEAALAHMTPEQIRSQFALVEEEDVENNKRRCRLCGDIYKAKNDTGHGSTTSLRRHAMDSHLQQFLVLFPVPALLPGAQPPPAVLVFCSLIFNTYVFFLKNGRQDPPFVGRLSQSDLYSAYAVRTAYSGSSFNSVCSTAEKEFFDRTFKKFDPDLLPPNPGKLKADVLRLWTNKARPKVLFALCLSLSPMTDVMLTLVV